jgi:enoyl-CoA hydratase/carnithine racemase
VTELRSDLDSGVLTLTIARAAARNTITYPLLEELVEQFDRVNGDPGVRVLVVTGEGQYFSAGTDLSPGGSGYDAAGEGFVPLRGRDRDLGGELALRAFALMKPCIAAVNGTAVGIGMTMILPMDVRIASESARFGLPFTRRGIVPESCSSWFLPRIVGIATAVEWAITGRIFGADEALAAGLVHELVPEDQVLARAHEVAAEVAKTTSPVSVALTRQLMWRQLGSPHPKSANLLESAALIAVGSLPDATEGVRSFLQKRPAAFTTRVPGDVPDLAAWDAEWPS